MSKYPGVKTAHECTDDGYIIEVSFPFSELGIENPNDGLIIGLEVNNNDDDDPESNAASDRGVLYWNTATNAGNPATWGNLCLYNKAKPVISSRGTAVIDGQFSADEPWTFMSEATSAELSYK